MSTFAYACEKIGDAVHTLATSEGDLRKRLLAAKNYLPMPTIGVPTNLNYDVDELKSSLTILGTDPDELRRVAGKLVAVAFRMYEELGRQSPKM